MKSTRNQLSATMRKKTQRRTTLERLEERALLSFAPIPQPDAAYLAATTNIPITIADGTTTTSLADATETVTFSQAMTAATVPAGGWTTWGAPPATESSTPRVLSSDTSNSVTVSFSRPTATFGVEMEPFDFGSHSMTATFFEGTTQIGSITQDVEGDAGALLFAASTPDQAFTSVVLTTDGTSGGFAIAQVRYTPANAVLTATKAVSGRPGEPGHATSRIRSPPPIAGRTMR